MARETNRWTAGRRARDSGLAQITGPIVLVQDSGKTAGFLFYAPFYRSRAPDSVSERRAAFLGMVYAPFVVKKLMEGVLSTERRNVGIHLQDGGQVIYDEYTANNQDYDPDPMFERKLSVELYGRNWAFDIRSSISFREAEQSQQPATLLVAGVLIDGLLIGLFFLMGRHNRRLGVEVEQRKAAEASAASARDELEVRVRQRTAELTQSNADLQQFAYSASHDLRTPLRGIANLVTFLDEDHTAELSPEALDLMGKVRTRVKRLDRLLDALLVTPRSGVSWCHRRRSISASPSPNRSKQWPCPKACTPRSRRRCPA
jgi:signal transduction histidine kinase